MRAFLLFLLGFLMSTLSCPPSVNGYSHCSFNTPIILVPSPWCLFKSFEFTLLISTCSMCHGYCFSSLRPAGVYSFPQAVKIISKYLDSRFILKWHHLAHCEIEASKSYIYSYLDQKANATLSLLKGSHLSEIPFERARNSAKFSSIWCLNRKKASRILSSCLGKQYLFLTVF